jgi:hypothetical protein
LDLAQTFDNISKKMRTDFDEIRDTIKHSGEKGRSFEQIVSTFLEKYLPKSLDISTGFIIDSNGNQSKQMDIIISDATKTPIFFQDASTRVLPVECVRKLEKKLCSRSTI